jgi:DNA polymerase-3 subunit gamma/tau
MYIAMHRVNLVYCPYMSEQKEQHIALYRKYRPSTFAEVLGQDHIVSVLQGQISKKTPGHAYLFYGTRGLGKTSIARLFAADLGCNPEDIYEIDGASNRKIEHVRELRESVHTRPLNSPYKVYIIDEVHMLTKEAFNALLKTLEEPPAHVIFILATTELHKLPDTIISRCQVFTFKQPSLLVLRDHVTALAEKEGYILAPESADLIALLGDGSFRDTIGVLEKAMMFSNDKKLDPDEVAKIVGAPRQTLVHQYLEGVATGNIDTSLQALATATTEQIDMKLFGELVLRKVRMVMRSRFEKSYLDTLQSQLVDTEYAFIEKLRGKEGIHINAGLLVQLLKASDMIRTATIPSLPLELLVYAIAEKKA